MSNHPSPSAATRLLSGAGAGPLDFLEPRYCAVLSEDAPQGATVVSVAARHTRGKTFTFYFLWSTAKWNILARKHILGNITDKEKYYIAYVSVKVYIER